MQRDSPQSHHSLETLCFRFPTVDREKHLESLSSCPAAQLALNLTMDALPLLWRTLARHVPDNSSGDLPPIKICIYKPIVPLTPDSSSVYTL